MEDAAKPSAAENVFNGIAFNLSAFLLMPVLVEFIKLRGMF